MRLIKRGKRYFFCNRTEPLQQFISFGISEQTRNRNLILIFCWVPGSLVRFSLVHFGFLQQGFRIQRRQNPTACVSLFLTLSSTASRSCPSPRSTPGSRRRTGSSRWSRDCCGRCRDGSEPGVLNTNFDKLLTLSRVSNATRACVLCVAAYPELGTRVREEMDLPEVISSHQEAFIVTPADSVDVSAV